MTRRPYPALEGCEQHLFVPRAVYDADVRVGMPTRAHARAQFALDFPRCVFRRNGARVACMPTDLDHRILRYCTQSVMGLPVEVLHNSGVIPRECNAPLIVEVLDPPSRRVGHGVRVRKQLMDHTCRRYIDVQVAVDDDTVLVKIRLWPAQSSSRSTSCDAVTSNGCVDEYA